MATPQTKHTPTYLAYSVIGDGPRKRWTKIGAAFRHPDGKGLSIELDAIPVNARIVLREPQIEEADHVA